MSPETSFGKKHALKALEERREASKVRKPIDNASLPAGSPMFFPCIACGYPIRVPEDYLTKPSLCGECSALKELGWME